MGRARATGLALLAVILMAGVGRPAPSTQLSSSGTAAAVIIVQGRIDDFTRDVIERRFAQARAGGAKTIILQLDTYGGLVTAALDISRFIKNQSDLHTIAYVNTKAISAGAMIAMACDEIVMADDAVIGDCAPIAVENEQIVPLPTTERAKLESPILADFRDSAQRNHRSVALAEAMVAVDRVVYAMKFESGGGSRTVRVVDEKGYHDLIQRGWDAVGGVPEPLDSSKTLLTLHTRDAMAVDLIREVEPSVGDLAQRRDLNIIRTYAQSAMDSIVELLSSNAARFILLIIFLQAFYIAIHTPGHGAPEAVALLSLGLLVGLPLLTGYAQWWELLIIFGGLALVAFEIFVFPGHIVSGAIGVIMIIAGLILTFAGSEPGNPLWPTLAATRTALAHGVYVVTGAMGVSLLLWAWLSKYLPRLPYFGRLVLTATTGNIAAQVREHPESGPMIGDRGVALTDLKPGGTVRFLTESYPAGRVAAVVSDSGYVPAGSQVIVREVGGARIVVRSLDAASSHADVSPVQVGQIGVTVSDLRPCGMVDFDGVRIEALSEIGIVGAGKQVKVVALVNNRPTVRPV